VLAAFVADPIPFFHRSKTLRDVRGLVAAVGERARSLAPDERYVLVLEKRRPGHLANPMVAFYLDAWELTDRVTLAGVGDPRPLLAALPDACARQCGRPLDVPFLASLGLRDPLDQSPAVRRLLGLAPTIPGPRVGRLGAVAWAPNVPAATPPGLVALPLDGLALYEAAPR